METTPNVANSGTPQAATTSASRQAQLYRRFAILTVGGTSIGAAIAVWQWWNDQVGVLEYTLLVVFYLFTAFGIEAGFHRYFSHAAFSSGPRVTYLLGAMGSMAAEGPVLFWAATHRQHHGFTDQAGDPHSPHVHDGTWSGPWSGRIQGLIHAHMGWLFATQHSSWVQFAPDLLRRRAVMTINQHYLLWVFLGLALPALLACFISGSLAAAGNGLIWGGLLRIFLLHHVTWAVNSLAHCFGQRPYATHDRSGNLAWLALPSVGGAWHNNHHAMPASARNDHQSCWQIDLSAWFIEMLGVLGLATDIKRPEILSGRFTTTDPELQANPASGRNQPILERRSSAIWPSRPQPLLAKSTKVQSTSHSGVRLVPTTETSTTDPKLTGSAE